jgi:hypothetical protein
MWNNARPHWRKLFLRTLGGGVQAARSSISMLRIPHSTRIFPALAPALLKTQRAGRESQH